MRLAGFEITLTFCMALTATALAAQDKSTLVAQDEEDHGWMDPRTGSTWMPWDNNKDVTWSEAQSYCGSLDFDGHNEWRLPSIDDLEGIYDPNAPGYLAGPLERSSDWLWSSTHSSWGGNWGCAAWLVQLRYWPANRAWGPSHFAIVGHSAFATSLLLYADGSRITHLPINGDR